MGRSNGGKSSPSPNDSHPRSLVQLAKLGFGLGILVLLFVWVDLQSLFQIFYRLGSSAIGILFLIYTSDRLVMAYKWYLLVRSRQAEVRFWTLVRAYNYSALLGPFVPATVGGDAIRFLVVRLEPISRELLVSSMVVEKLLGFLAMLIMAAGAVIWLFVELGTSGIIRGLVVGMLVGIAGTAAVVGVFVFEMKITGFARRLLEKLGKGLSTNIKLVRDIVNAFLRDRKTISTFLLLSLVEQAIPPIFMFALASVLGGDVSFVGVFCVTLLTLLISRIPISIGGIGVQEGAFVGLFLLIGLGKELALAISLAARMCEFIFPLPILFVDFGEVVRFFRQARRGRGAIIGPNRSL
jgi:uncharacterized protein (TIRG00374 family)